MESHQEKRLTTLCNERNVQSQGIGQKEYSLCYQRKENIKPIEAPIHRQYVVCFPRLSEPVSCYGFALWRRLALPHSKVVNIHRRTDKILCSMHSSCLVFHSQKANNSQRHQTRKSGIRLKWIPQNNGLRYRSDLVIR